MDEALAAIGVLAVADLAARARAGAADAPAHDLGLPSTVVRPYRISDIAEQVSGIERLGEVASIVIAGAELMLLEALAELDLGSSVFVSMPQATPDAVVAEVAMNFPPGLVGGAARLPSLPPVALAPTSSMVLAVGFNGGSGMALLHEYTDEVVRFWSSTFFLPIYLIDAVSEPVLERGPGWSTVLTRRVFTARVCPDFTEVLS